MEKLKSHKNIYLIVLYVFGGLISFSIFNLYVRHIIGDRFFLVSSIMNKKLHYLKETHEKFDIYFMGSSYIYRHVQPNVIDPILNNNGLSFSSYSFSEGGSFAFEIEHYINELKRFPKEKLPKYVVIDLYSADKDNVIHVNKENFLIPRIVEYHDWRTTFINIRILMLSSRPLFKKLQSAYEHLLHTVYRYSNIGLGKLYLTDKLQTDILNYFSKKMHQMREGRGYIPDLSGNNSKSSKFSAKEYTHMQTFFKNHYHDPKSAKELFTKADFLFRKQQYSSLISKGISVIYLIPPRPYEMKNDFSIICGQKDFPPCIYMNDPFLFPEIFEVENRWDNGHLNDKGSQIFSKYFAQELVSVIKKREQGN